MGIGGLWLSREKYYSTRAKRWGSDLKWIIKVLKWKPFKEYFNIGIGGNET